MTEAIGGGESTRPSLMSEGQLRAMFAEAPIGVAVVDTVSCQVRTANRRYTEITGRSLDELRRLSWVEFTHPDDVTPTPAGWFDGLVTRRHLAKRYVRPDGSMVWVEMWAFPLEPDADGRKIHLCMVEDITARILGAEQLEQSQRQYRMLADHAGDVIMQLRDGNIEWVSPSVQVLLGHAPEDLVGTDSTELVHLADRACVSSDRRACEAGNVVVSRARYQHGDGRWIWLDTRTSPMFDREGQAMESVVSTLWDVHAEVEALEQAELIRRETDDLLRRAERMASLGVLAGGIAHDFNNLLAGIIGTVDVLLREVGPDDPQRALLERIIALGQRGQDLTGRLLDSAGARLDVHPVPLDTVEALQAAIDSAVGACKDATAVEVIVEAAAEVRSVLCDRSQFHQIVTNLVINGLEACAGKAGTVTVRVGDAPDGEHLVIDISDTGIGMTPALRNRIFEPFFTTKNAMAANTGTHGLGLAIVHGSILANHGTIETTSQQEVGTTFRVLLPAAMPPPTPPATGTTTVTASSSLGRRVIIVDDEDAVRDVCRLVLEHAGMEVDAFSSGVTALARFRQDPASYSAAVIDLTMPEMPGEDLVVHFRGLRSDVAVIVITGYTTTDVRERLAHVDVDEFVHKPFRAHELVDAVHRAVAHRTSRLNSTPQA